MSSRVKNIFTIAYIFIMLGSCVYAAQGQSRVILTDFRNVNLFEAFYAYDKKKNDYVFTKLDRKTYKKLSPENKAIYKRVKKSNKIYIASKRPMPDFIRINKRQDAYKINKYNLPAANALVFDFQKDKKYSTALYYALQIKKYDKKNKYPDLDYRIGALYYMLGYFDDCIPYLEKNLSLQKPFAQKDTRIMLADSYNLTAENQKNPNEYYKRALLNADKVLNNEQNAKMLEVKYNACYNLKSYRSAMAAAESLMKLNPQSADYALKYANCRGALNDKQTELIYLQKAKNLANKGQKNEELMNEINLRLKNFGVLRK